MYSHVERNHHIKREDLPENLEILHNILKGVLGAGVMVLERVIAKNLYERLNLNFVDHEDWALIDYVKDAEQLTGS
ncbi:MAG: hypothetical protein QXL25_01650 [Candidatus Bathyarchaeia archaeon]